MNCIKDGKFTGDSCFGCEIKDDECDIRYKLLYRPRWISVSERLPVETGYYLITNKAGRVEYLWYKETEKKWYFYNSDTEHLNVIAWQFIPEPFIQSPNTSQ